LLLGGIQKHSQLRLYVYFINYFSQKKLFLLCIFFVCVCLDVGSISRHAKRYRIDLGSRDNAFLQDRKMLTVTVVSAVSHLKLGFSTFSPLSILLQWKTNKHK